MKKFLPLLVLLVYGQVVLASDTDCKVITVNGQGVVSSTPSLLDFSIYVEERGETASKLNDKVNFKSKQIIDLLTDTGVQHKDIQSMQVNLYPWYERDRNSQIQKGFVLSRLIKVTLRDFANYTSVLDGLSKIGTQRIDGFQYRAENSDAIYLRALELALDDANKRANKISKSLGIKIGKVVSVNEHSAYSPVPEQMMMSNSRSMDSAGFLPGQINTSAMVSVKYSIVD